MSTQRTMITTTTTTDQNTVIHERSFTTIVTGPGHLIGSRKQVEAFFAKGKGELPPWYEEWHDLLPGWYMQILETPAEVAQFFLHAEADITTPHVAFITNTVMSLSCGATIGAEDHWSSRWALRHAQHFNVEAQLEAKNAEALHKRQRAEARAQAEVAAGVDDDDGTDLADAPLPMGVSARTQRRDALLRHTSVPVRLGVCCPRCGRRQLDPKGLPHTAESLRRSGWLDTRCLVCGDVLGQMARGQDSVSDRTCPIFQTEAWQTYATDIDGKRLVPWGTRPESNPRIALGPLIGKRYKGCIDVYLADEAHEYKGATSAVGAAFGALVDASHKTVALTGTLFGGYARDLYYLLLRLNCRPVVERWGWSNQPQFVKDAGVVEVIDKEIERNDAAGHYNGQSKKVKETKERAGITATLASIVQNKAIQVLLKHMGFNLVDYMEDLVTLPMPAAVAHAYGGFEAEAKAMIADGAYDILSGYLQAGLSFPYQPWKSRTIWSKIKDDGINIWPAVAADTIMPHHTWLANYAAGQVKQGRRVLVYCEHTDRDDIMPDIQQKLTQLAKDKHGVELKVAILRSTTVKPGDRRAWFSKQEADGTNVVLCNPRLVKTGLNLIGWPSIVVLEPVYSLYNLFQAKRRAFRPTQTKDCEVMFVAYEDTLSEKAIALIAKKAAAAAILSGDDLSGGLMEFDPGQSLLQELAKAVTNGDGNAMNDDIRAMLRKGAQALKADMEQGAAALVGAMLPIQAVERSDEEALPALTVAAAAAQITAIEAVVTDEPIKQPLWKQVEVFASKTRKKKAAADEDAVAVQYSMF